MPQVRLPDLGEGSSSGIRAGSLTLSSAEHSLFADGSPTTTAAAELLRQGNLSAAILVLETALQSNRNDPEARIFLDNARAQQQGDPLSLAVVVPISSNPKRAKEGVAQAQEDFARSAHWAMPFSAAEANALQEHPLALLGGDLLFGFNTLQQGATLESLVVAMPWHLDVPP
ncbi:MAG: hypothetical protein ACUVRV_00660 [Cyanobacteriota bacterium]